MGQSYRNMIQHGDIYIYMYKYIYIYMVIQYHVEYVEITILWIHM